MISDSRLSKVQKSDRKAMLAGLAVFMGGIVTSEDNRVTIAFEPEFKGSRMMRVGVSVASPNERKIRRKVGEYHALTRLSSYSKTFHVPDGVDMYALANVIAAY